MTERWRIERTGTETRWADEEDPFDTDERSSSYPLESLVTIRFLWNAVRRHSLLWMVVAMAGFAVGLAMPAILPPASVASTKLLLTHRDGDDPTRAMATDVRMVTTHTIATRVIDRLGLNQTPDKLLEQYTATALTDRMMQITVKAPTSAGATKLAVAIADDYLRFRKEQIALLQVPLQKDLLAASTAVDEARADVIAAGGDPNDANLGPTPDSTRLTAASDKLQYLQQQLRDAKTSASLMNTSRVLDAAAPVPQSRLKATVVDVGAGLLAGMFLGVGFVVVRALISDRLWRRQDIACTIGAPVRLSIGRPPRVRPWPLPRYLRKSQTQKLAVRLVVRHLRANVLFGEHPKPALAVVSVDDEKATALIVASLAMSFAEEGKNVLAVDLSASRALAANLGVTSAGTQASPLSGPDIELTVHLPAKDAVPAEGPHLLGGDAAVDDDRPLTQAWAGADIVLTLATLTPALGAEHLRTWTSRATAVVTAGRSTMTTVRSVGEMLRLAGIELVSAVVLRTDRTDDGVGALDDEVRPAKAEAGIEMVIR